MRLGPEAATCRRMIKAVKSSATSTKPTTAMSRLLGRPAISVETTASGAVEFVADGSLGVTAGGGCAWPGAGAVGGLDIAS